MTFCKGQNYGDKNISSFQGLGVERDELAKHRGFFLIFFLMFIFERDRERAQVWEGQIERGTEDLNQALHGQQ